MKFIESICFENGDYQNLHLHQARVKQTFLRYDYGQSVPNLKDLLPNLDFRETYKVRIIYDVQPSPNIDIEYAEYHLRKVETLEVIQSSPFDYTMKYADRRQIDKLTNQSGADDIIIAIDGRITDGSYFNLAFWDGEEWYTPETCLLNGVRRQKLLLEGKIKEEPIAISDLSSFKKVSLINAMMDLGIVQIPIEKIKQ